MDRTDFKMSEKLHNWAGNFAYAAETVHAPKSLDELQAIVRGASKVRAVGSRHCFNKIADTDGDLISMRGLNRLIKIDDDARTVTIEGGMTYSELCPLLDARGFALHNLASLPHISVVGAVATATHGSGNANGNLATAVAGLQLVATDGELVSLKRGDADFDGAVVGLGALGVVSEITLDIQPRFDMRQDVFVDMPFDSLVENFDAITSAAYSVSCFTTWTGEPRFQVWLKNLAGAEVSDKDVFGAAAADRPMHPIPTIDPGPCTSQMGEVGPWYERLPHFGMDEMPSAGEELQSEYFVARQDAPAALAAIRSVQDTFSPLLMTSEVRTMAADNLWLSQSYGRDMVGFHFTWQRDYEALVGLLPALEGALAPFGPIPHWGKVFTMPVDAVHACYERLDDFRALAGRLDPAGKFRNAFLDKYVF